MEASGLTMAVPQSRKNFWNRRWYSSRQKLRRAFYDLATRPWRPR